VPCWTECLVRMRPSKTIKCGVIKNTHTHTNKWGKKHNLSYEKNAHRREVELKKDIWMQKINTNGIRLDCIPYYKQNIS
jgi:hypothetical protein